MQRIIVFYLLYTVQPLKAQELFVFTESASNMATSGAGIRLNNAFMKVTKSARTEYLLIPELMFGVSKKLMLHGAVFFSNEGGTRFGFNGGSIYGKYRFYSEDEVHSHFRMAIFEKISTNNGIIQQPAIDLNGYNSGYETGMVFTKLLNKIALSTSFAFLHATDNSGHHIFNYGASRRNAIGYSLSAGKLLLPKEYTSYRQVNLNAMLELLGQVNAGSCLGYLDAAPSLQLIINSVMRIDLGAKIALISKLQRTAPGGCFVRVEYNLFNLFKK